MQGSNLRRPRWGEVLPTQLFSFRSSCLGHTQIRLQGHCSVWSQFLSSSFTSLGVERLKGPSQDFVARGRPITVSHGALAWRCQAALGCTSRLWKKTSSTGSDRCYIQSSKSLDRAAWLPLGKCCGLAVGWPEIVEDCPLVLGFSAPICWQTDPTPSQQTLAATVAQLWRKQRNTC